MNSGTGTQPGALKVVSTSLWRSHVSKRLDGGDAPGRTFLYSFLSSL